MHTQHTFFDIVWTTAQHYWMPHKHEKMREMPGEDSSLRRGLSRVPCINTIPVFSHRALNHFTFPYFVSSLLAALLPITGYVIPLFSSVHRLSCKYRT